MISDKKIFLWDGIFIQDLSTRQTVAAVKKAVDEGWQIHREDLNAHKVAMMQQYPAFKKKIISANLIQPDGQSIVWAVSVLRGDNLHEAIGVNTEEDLVKVANLLLKR